MILGPISLLDCLVFVLLLVPQLLLQVNLVELVRVGVASIPFFLLTLPSGLFQERLLLARVRRPPFVQQATFFQDLVIRCVRYAFANFPASVGRVFFSKSVALPFARWRMLRHGIFSSSVTWYEVDINVDMEADTDFKAAGNEQKKESTTKGVWIVGSDDSQPPDVVVYYVHGGGFAMGSAYFYLEPLIALRDLLLMHYRNPAVFALEYALVPDAAYPVQLDETKAGYEYVLKRLKGDASRVCMAGDSAGGTLVLSMLLDSAMRVGEEVNGSRPGYATLISPWTSLVSEGHRNTKSDFLSAETLHVYGSQYAKLKENLTDPLVSPGCCMSASWWEKAGPLHGIYVAFGSEEVLGPDVRELVKRWREAGISVMVQDEPGGIHAWPIARLFLEESMEQRARGMKDLVSAIVANIK